MGNDAADPVGFLQSGKRGIDKFVGIDTAPLPAEDLTSGEPIFERGLYGRVGDFVGQRHGGKEGWVFDRLREFSGEAMPWVSITAVHVRVLILCVVGGKVASRCGEIERRPTVASLLTCSSFSVLPAVLGAEAALLGEFHAGRNACRLSHSRLQRSANAGSRNAQCGARPDDGHFRSRAGPDGTIRPRMLGDEVTGAVCLLQAENSEQSWRKLLRIAKKEIGLE